MYADNWQKHDYLNWLYKRLIAIKEILSEKGSIYLHLDWHIGHYAKILMDEIFGEENFANEIIWNYVSGGISKTCFAKKHDTIYFYKKSSNAVFNIQKERNIKKFSKINPSKIFEDEKGQFIWYIRPNTNNKVPNGVKSYLDKYVQDVWEIPIVNPQAKERINYSTQKPEALLQRIIEASSNENMIVADFFSGSGVTAAVAHKLNRKFIACDIGRNAIAATRDRLVKNNADFDILKIQSKTENEHIIKNNNFNNCSKEKDNAFITIKPYKNQFLCTIEKYASPYLKQKIDSYNNKNATRKIKKPPIIISDNGIELIEAVQFDTTLSKNIWTSNLDLEDRTNSKEQIKASYILATDKFNIKIRNIVGNEIIICSKDIIAHMKK